MNPRFQNTIRQAAKVTGFGFWYGRDVKLEFRPADVNSGIVFVRNDLKGQPRIPATIEFQKPTPRRTNLYRGSAHVEMIEHVMAALAGLQIDNCEVWVDQPEMPGCDGSAREFVYALQNSGIEAQHEKRTSIQVLSKLRAGNEQAWIEIRPADEYQVGYLLDYGPGPIGKQQSHWNGDTPSFCQDISCARTFVKEDEAESIRQMGFGSRVSYRDLLVFREDGPIDNRLRFDNECARHKLLDVIGDLAMTGMDICGHVTAYRCGHRLNGELVRQIVSSGKVESVRRRSA